jgi:hypothetical protein
MESSKKDKQQSKDQLAWFKKHKILTGILIFFILCVISAAASPKKEEIKDSNKADSTTKTEKKAEPETAGLNTPVRDGKFEFTVTGITCGVATVGDNPYLQKTAQGQYCILAVNVKNIGDKAQTLFSANQKVLVDGKEYSADDAATLYAAPNGQGWLSEINPDNSVNGKIVFDLPKGVTPIIAKLHDSAYSGGATVKLQ